MYHLINRRRSDGDRNTSDLNIMYIWLIKESTSFMTLRKPVSPKNQQKVQAVQISGNLENYDISD